MEFNDRIIVHIVEYFPWTENGSKKQPYRKEGFFLTVNDTGFYQVNQIIRETFQMYSDIFIC